MNEIEELHLQLKLKRKKYNSIINNNSIDLANYNDKYLSCRSCLTRYINTTLKKFKNSKCPVCDTEFLPKEKVVLLKALKIEFRDMHKNLKRLLAAKKKKQEEKLLGLREAIMENEIIDPYNARDFQLLDHNVFQLEFMTRKPNRESSYSSMATEIENLLKQFFSEYSNFKLTHHEREWYSIGFKVV